jgi:hypothetical protein
MSPILYLREKEKKKFVGESPLLCCGHRLVTRKMH